MSFTKLKFKLKITRKVPNFEWNKHHFIFMFYMLYAVCIIFSLNWYISVCGGPFFFFDFQGSREFCCMWYLLVGVVLLSFTKLKFTLFKIILTRKAPNFQWNKHHFIFIFYMLYAVATTLSLNWCIWCISVCRGPFFSLISKVQESFAVCGKYSIVFTRWQCLHGILMWNIFYTYLSQT